MNIVVDSTVNIIVCTLHTTSPKHRATHSVVVGRRGANQLRLVERYLDILV
jgi:hypothetical protein